MPQTLIVFDFGANEEAAQQARHRLEGWRQVFRLGDRLKLKFERQAPSAAPEPAEAEPAKAKKGKGKSAGKSDGKKKASGDEGGKTQAPDADRLRLMVRLEFSSHEKLSYQQWIGRIEAEPLLQGTNRKIWQRGQEGFDEAAETFDSLP